MTTTGKERNLEEIKKWLLKHEFIERQSTPGTFIKGVTPNQRLVDLTQATPWVGVFDGKERSDWDAGHGITEMPDIYNAVMLLWNTKYKDPKPQESKSEPEQKLPFVCHDCEAGITAEQRVVSFKAQGMALCTDCESKHQNANDKTPREKSDTIAPPPMSSFGEQSPNSTSTHEGVFSDEVAIAGAIQHLIKEGVKSSEQIGEVVLYWCGGDKKRAERLISQIVVGVASVQKTKEKPKSKEKEKPKEKPKEVEVVDPAKEKPGEPPKVEKPGENLPEVLPAKKTLSDRELSKLLDEKAGKLQIGKCEAVALQYGIPAELANLFFMSFDAQLYIKNPGLLYLAGKKGYSRIEIIDKYDENKKEWSAECKIYPKLTKEILEGIGKLDKDIQKTALDFATQPTNGTGRASVASVKMSTMQPFLREMAQTRAQNRALRAYTGYGGTSAEELPEGNIETT